MHVLLNNIILRTLFLLFFSVPTINKLPDGEWFCRGCAFIGNVRKIILWFYSSTTF